MATERSVHFSWDDVERLPELRRLGFVLEQLPDEGVVSALEARRGRGRNECPARAMWRALVAGVVFGHGSSASLLRELGRNPALLGVCGFDPLGRQAPPRRTVSGMVDALRGRLMAELPGYGRHLGCDGKAVPSRSTGNASAAAGRTSDPDADWGRHETSGVDRAGKAWKKVKRWFGYRLHLVADVEHELPVWFEVTRASRSEHKALAEGLDGLFGAEPGLARRCADFVADRGLDSGPLRRRLWDGHRIRPLVDVREMWREERAEPGHDPSKPIRRSLAADGGGNILRTEKGEVSCRCPATKALRPMAFQGFEADRDCLKYRCPAAACGFECAGRAACLRDAGSKAGEYGRVVRIPLAGSDRRAFTPTPWGSPSWKRGYARRGALERINARLDNSFGFEHHFTHGRVRMKAKLGLALAVMMAVAAGRPERMRSLVDPGLPRAA